MNLSSHHSSPDPGSHGWEILPTRLRRTSRSTRGPEPTALNPFDRDQFAAEIRTAVPRQTGRPRKRIRAADSPLEPLTRETLGWVVSRLAPNVPHLMSRILSGVAILVFAAVLANDAVADQPKPARSKSDDRRPERPRPDRVETVTSVDGDALQLHVYLPPSRDATSDRASGDSADRSADDQVDDSGGRAAIVLFFGGGWVGGSPEQFAPQARHFADRGMVALCPQYRTRSSHNATPKDCVADGKTILAHIKQNADRYGIDPARIVAGGGSAGGHVAAASVLCDAIGPPSSDVAALVLFNPVFDNGPDGWGHAKVQSYWRDISPMHNIDADAPPTIVFLGTQDKLIPVATARRYGDQMRKFDRRYELKTYSGQGHGFFNRGDGYKQTLKSADAFLVELGLLPDQDG